MTVRAPVRVAYLTGVYPKASHTFIQREISAVRSHGIDVLPATIRQPAPEELIGPEETEASAETFSVLANARAPWRLLPAHLRLLFRRPVQWLSAIGLAARTGRPGVRGTLWQVFYFLEAGVLADHLNKNNIDHLHNHFADSSATVAMLAAKMADIPFSFTLHGPAELYEPQSWRLDEKIARAAFTVCISHFARSQAMLFSDPAHWERMKIVHCGVDPASYLQPTPEDGDTAVSFLFVGRLTRIKGLPILLAAFEQARAQIPDLKLTLIGDGEDRAWIEAEANRIGNVTLLGYQSQSNVAVALGQADAFVLPSFAEGVPVVLMEALAAAKPIIATQVGGVGELVEPNVSGLLLPPGDADALSKALVTLATDAGLRRRMGAAGREKVRRDFDISKEGARLARLFRDDPGDGPRPALDAS